jgi:hypothetical protein
MSATYDQKLHATSADRKNESPFCAGPAGGAPSAPRQLRWSGPLHGTAPSGQCFPRCHAEVCACVVCG